NSILQNIQTDDSYTKVITLLKAMDIKSSLDLYISNYLITFLRNDREYKLKTNNQMESKLSNYELHNSLLNLINAIENPAYKLDIKNYSPSENKRLTTLIRDTIDKLDVTTENIYHNLKNVMGNVRELYNDGTVTNLEDFKTELIIELDLFEDTSIIEPSDDYNDILNKLSEAHREDM